jgi:hypothetical protein
VWPDKEFVMTRNNYSILLWLFCIISPFALIPFVRAVAFFAGTQLIPLTPYMLIFMALEATIGYGLLIFIGMKCAELIGARFLLLEANPDFHRDMFKPGLLSGIACAFAVLLVDTLLPASPFNLFALASSISPLVGFFCLFFCIINQEVIICLFLLSGIAVILKRLLGGLSHTVIMIISIALMGLIFGIAHLPVFLYTTAENIPLLITRIMLLSGIAGIVFGTLFWKKSFEAAVWAHFVVDFILYVLVPMYSMIVHVLFPLWRSLMH